jgi:hypothetical protein
MIVYRKYRILGLALIVAGCGKAGNLEPRTAQSLPPQAYGQTASQSAESLLTPTAQARPSRSDELLRRSERRTDDAFDLPPGNEGAVGKQENEKAAEKPPVVLTPAPKT